MMKRGVKADGEAIRAARKFSGMTQEVLAAYCECSPRTIRAAEAGKHIDVLTLANIANALKVSIAQLSAVTSGPEEAERNRQIVTQWDKAYREVDVERLLSFHHPEVITEIPGSDGLPGGGNFTGIDQLREHLIDVFKAVRFEREHSVECFAERNKVFHRAHVTWKVLPSNAEFTSVFVNEFTFQDGKIIYRITVSDLSPLHRLLGENV